MVDTKIRLIIFFAAKDEEALYSQQKQDWELTVAHIMNSLLPNSDLLKKVGKTTGPFRYDPNQIPYDYTVEVTNRFKGVYMIDRLPDELQMEVCDIVQETGIKTISKKQKCKKAKWLSEEALQTAKKKKKSERQGRKGKIYPFECRNPKKARRDNKAFLNDQCKEIEETIEWERLEISSRK